MEIQELDLQQSCAISTAQALYHVSGHIANAQHSLLLGITMLGLRYGYSGASTSTWLIVGSEAMFLGRCLGLKPQILADIINSSTGRCWSSEVSGFRQCRFSTLLLTILQVNHPDPDVVVANQSPPAHRDYAGGFVTKLAHKDLALAVKAAVEVQAPLDLGKRCEEIYRPLATHEVFGSCDFSSVYKALRERRSNVE